MAASDEGAAAFHPDMDYLAKNLQFLRSRSFLFTFTIFTVVIFFIICLIYSLYMWTYRWQLSLDQALAHWVTPASSPATGAGVGIEIAIGPGLDPVVINILPIVSFGSSSAGRSCKGADCAICLCSFQDGEKVKVSPECYHAFHCECLDRWLVTHSSCPLCRAPVRYSDYSVSDSLRQDGVPC